MIPRTVFALLVFCSGTASAGPLDSAGHKGKTGVLARLQSNDGMLVSFTGASCPEQHQKMLPIKAYYAYARSTNESTTSQAPASQSKDGCWYKFPNSREVLISWSVATVGHDPEMYSLESLQGP